MLAEAHNERRDSMSYHEKSAWACLSSILLVYIPYFAVVFSNPGYLVVPLAFISAVIVLVIILVVSHVLFAIHSPKIRKKGQIPPRDEREMSIELRAMKVSSYVLSVIVITCCVSAYIGIPIARIKQHTVVSSVNELQSGANQELVNQTMANQIQGDLSLSNLLPIPTHDALLFVHVLLMGFVISNIAYYAAIVFGYRRSV